MKPSSIALALALAAAAAPAAAQYNQAPQQRPQTATAGAANQQAAPASPLKISRGAVKALGELKAAVDANDVANIPAKVAAAQAVAKNPDDRYAVGGLQYKAAINAKDSAAKAAALEAIIASGSPAAQGQLAGLYADLANTYTDLKQPARSAAALEHLLALDPNNVEALIVYANALKAQGRVPDAVAHLQKAIAAKKAAGSKADERIYKHAVQLAYDAKLPSAIEVSRHWVADYPSAMNWRNALAIYRRLGSDDDQSVLDVLRLQRALGALDNDGEFNQYAFIAVQKGFAGEAKLMIEEAIAARKADPNKKLIKDIVVESTQKSARDRAEMEQNAAAALAGPEARRALVTGDAYFGYGNYAKAAELYRSALTKTGADKDLINLHLGMALARAGDKAGATAALTAVTGPRAEIAKYWQLYVNTRA